MINKVRNLQLRLSRTFGDKFVMPPRISRYADSVFTPKKVLVVGVVLEDRKNHYKHISSVFNNSKTHDVQQLWAVLKADEKLEKKDKVQHFYYDEFMPRSKLINLIIKKYSKGEYDYIVITDDDIRLPKDFVDQFLMRQEQCDFSLAQPARTPNSIISHQITRQHKQLLARQTHFVEIGPVVSIRKDAQQLILPLDEASPMGWGLDYVWPALIKEANKKMGIIDCVPIAHTLRPVGKSYNSNLAELEMNDFLATKPSFTIRQSHVVINEIY